jgi:hypothetical protein
MNELKLTDPIKVGYIAYHIGLGGKIDDLMKIKRVYDSDTVERAIKEGWSFISQIKKYKKGQKASIPKSQILHIKYTNPPSSPPPLPPSEPVKLTGICLVNKSSTCAITCISLKNAYEKLFGGMTDQDKKDLINGKLCVMVKIMRTPDQFKN